MRSSRVPYAAVGAFVLVALVGVIAAVAVLQGRTGATDTYYTAFDRVTGVKFGTQVLYQGFAVGQVARVEPAETGPRFRVELSVRRGWPIDRDASVYITQGGSFLSAMVLDIRGGGSDELLQPGAQIRGAAAGDLFAVVSDAAVEMRELMDSAVRPLVTSAADELPAVLANLRTFTARLDETGERMNALLSEENVDRLGRTLGNAESVSQDMVELTASLGETRRRMDAAIATLQRMAESNEGDLRQAVNDLQYTLEVVAGRIDALTHNLEATSRNMNEFSRQVRGNPGVLLRGGAPPDAAGGAAQ